MHTILGIGPEREMGPGQTGPGPNRPGPMGRGLSKKAKLKCVFCSRSGDGPVLVAIGTRKHLIIKGAGHGQCI